ncbi:MAG: hypothetical protein HOY71_26185 [Nonomuraea sp.]|nr:hypothetical protein [Nonomuraea sp.]
MTDIPPDRYGMGDDEQELEVAEWTEDFGRDHEIVEDDPEHRDTIGERLREEVPEREREPRPEHRLEGVADSDGEELGEDWGDDAGEDLSAEERAVRVDPDEDY